jgi:hypothetical protein
MYNNSYVFNITSKVGVNKLIIIDGDFVLENAIRKAKIETLKEFKSIKSDDEIVEMFHTLEYRFEGTIKVSGESYNIDKI